MSENEEWQGSFVETAISFLSSYFDVRAPKVVLYCEETCRWADRCGFTACYMPWRNQINFKSGSEKGYIVAHEFSHRLEKAGVIENGEAAAIEMEEWWMENVNELVCSECGYPIFVSDDTPIGSEVECTECGSVYETIPLRGRPEGIVISKGALAGATIGAPIVGTLLSAFIFDQLPKKALSRDENLKRTRLAVGGTVVGGFIGALGFLAVKS